MQPFHRRDFGRLAVASIGALARGRGVLAQQKPLLPPIKSTFNGVALGCNTYSLSTLPLDDAIQAIAGIGFGLAELHPHHVEPSLGSPGWGPGATGNAPQTQAQKIGPHEAREKLRQWRLTVPLDQFAVTARKFKDAGLYLYAYNMNFSDDFTDAELERTFEMTKALGCNLITAVGSNALFRRLDPLAQKHKILIGLHNEGMIRSVVDFENVAKGLSDYTKFTLDLGHFVANGGDPIAMLEKHHDRIVNVHIKDRKKDNGPNMPFGQGDTPIKQVLIMMRDRKYGIPGHIEWEVAAGRDERIAAVRRCLDYCKQALDS
jgi:sugar phosphate isomerase/epimerase